jgi:hypothetical protein
MMRSFHQSIAACMQSMSLLAAFVTGLLLGACAPTQLVVTVDPQLARIRSVYVLPFDSLHQNPEAATIMREALMAQLKYDRIFQVVEDPKLADAYFKGTLGNWASGGLDLDGARSSEVSGSLKLLNPVHQPLWVAAAIQRDPLRLVAHGLFARPPSALAPYWARTVLQQLPGYTVKGRPETTTGREDGPSHPAS